MVNSVLQFGNIASNTGLTVFLLNLMNVLQLLIKTKFLPVLILSVLAFTYQPYVSSQFFMFLVGISIFVGSKWLTFWTALEKGLRPPLWLSLGYLLGWIGMDAEDFLNHEKKSAKPSMIQWSAAIIKTLIGIVSLWVIAPAIPKGQILIIGWVGVAGLLLVTFFGTFHLNALVWQYFGMNARHIMNSPLLATSLTNFWGARWNLAVHKLVSDYIFRPTVRRFGIAFATFLVFLVSGLAHETITSVPARAGYGLATLYFMIQCAGILFERSKMGKRLGLNQGARGWVFAFIFIACPFFLLFHPPFLIHVVIPILEKMHAIQE